MKASLLPPTFSGRFVRQVAITAIAIATLVACARWFNRTYRLDGWLVWTLLKVWGWQAVLAVALVASGRALLSRAIGLGGLPPLDLLALSVPVGAVAFAMGITAGGHLGLLNAEFAVAWPVVMIAASAWALRDSSDGTVKLLWRWSRGIPALSPRELLVGGLGCLGVGLVYLQILSPESTTYDATWTHLPIAQDYAREGRIVPFYADWPRNLAHLGSIINTWSFLVPGLEPQAMKTMMALHTEFAFFVWTLVAVAAGIARLGAPARGSWVALFLFPAFYYDDHCLGGGADHFLAFFAVPVFLGVLEAARTSSWRWWAYLAIVMAGAVLTKYQAFILVAPAAAILGAAVIARAIERRRSGQPVWVRDLWAGPVLALGLSLVLTAPHFLSNIIWYRNPIYPMGQRIFTASTPSMPDGALLAEYVQKNWGAHPATAIGPWLRNLVTAVASFPCHPKTPESGPMFVLALILTVLKYRRPYVDMTNRLPKNAVVLLHSEHPSLGLDRPTLHDWLGFQGLIDHRTFRNARDLYRRYQEVGVTHVLYQPNSHPADTRQDDAVFAVFAMRCRDSFRDWGPFRTFPMPADPPPFEPTYQVLTEGIPDQKDGLYPVTDLGTSEDLPRELQTRKPPTALLKPKTASSLIARARVLLLKRDSSIARDHGDVLDSEFEAFGEYRDFSVYVRR